MSGTEPSENVLAKQRSRRNLLKGAAIAAGGVGGALALSSGEAGAATPTFFFNVTSFGATGNGTTPDSAAIQSAINAASAGGGGIVQLPAGYYLLNSSLQVPNGVSLEGVGWHSPRNGDSNSFEGSWLIIRASKNGHGFVPIIVNGRGSSIRKLAFYLPEMPAPTANPDTAYPYSIVVNGDDVVLEDIHLYNVANGIYAVGIGRTQMHRISGQPLNVGIHMDNNRDTMVLDTIHFWPFWNISAWTFQNGIGVNSLRNDNPMMTNIFCAGYKYGIHFGLGTIAGATGFTSKFHLQNADLDNNYFGMFLDGINNSIAQPTGQMTNVSIQGQTNQLVNGLPNGGNSPGGIYSTNGCVIFASNLRITNVYNNAIRIDSPSGAARYFLDGFWCESWNLSGSAFPGIEIVAGDTIAHVWMTTTRAFDVGFGAPTVQPASQFTLG